MSSASSYLRGWQGTVLIAVTYVYFLIFAQFAFLARLASWQLQPFALKVVMAAMALGGISFSLLVPRLETYWKPRCLVRAGLTFSAAAAFLSLLHLNLLQAMPLGFLVGAALALLTVPLAAHVHEWAGGDGAWLRIGIGTGMGYLICNVPLLFNASAFTQAWIAGVLCLLALTATLTPMLTAHDSRPRVCPTLPAFRAIPCFTLLIWLDSAAFYIIQHEGILKNATWNGELHLYAIGLIHLLAACIAGIILSRNNSYVVLCAAFGFLACACLFLASASARPAATLLYPIGVSLYSVALVAWPAHFSGAANAAQRVRAAALLYAIAGWIGSAMGVGMAEHLGHVPPVFLLLTGLVVLSYAMRRLLQHRLREVAAIAGVLLMATLLSRYLSSVAPRPAEDAIARGRQVYISEGCIHCHSQYVRPNSNDVLIWGPASSVASIHSQQPPLIGNRRQGPDLSNVGNRRSPLWLRIHFLDPPSVSANSIMPSFAVLFADSRGQDLLAYLSSLRSNTDELVQARRSWSPTPESVAHADQAQGQQLYRRFCSTCHDADGTARQKWQYAFAHLPPDLLHAPQTHLLRPALPADYQRQIAQTIKFGIPGTDMPGHETLSDSDIASLAAWIAHQQATSGPSSPIP